jgi:hypothetical protein
MLLGLVIPLIIILFLHIVFFYGSLIAWKTKKQIAVSRSSAEAELCAMPLVTVEVTCLWWLLEDFGVSVSMTIPLLFDSTWAISIAHESVKYELIKHVGVDTYFTWSQVQDGVVALQYMPSELKLANFLKKAHTYHQFYLFKLNVVDPPWFWGGIRYVLVFLLLYSSRGSLYILPFLYMYIYESLNPQINISAIYNSNQTHVIIWIISLDF